MKINVLYTEDDPETADLTRSQLALDMPDLKIDIVPTTKQALAALDSAGPTYYEIALVDLHLPGEDGMVLLNVLRERALQIAVVIITGHGDEETAVAVLKAGADDYIVKRGDYLSRLALTLESALLRYRSRINHYMHPIRVLYAERNPADIDLTRRHMNRFAPHIHMEMMNTAAEITQHLAVADSEHPYDLILIDYRLPRLNALEWLKSMQQLPDFNIPVILVTGQGDEEVAVQALKLGAADYVVKNAGYLYQLITSIENTFHRTQLQHEQIALQKSEQRLRQVIQNMPVMLFAFDENSNIVFWNQYCERVTGYNSADIVGKTSSFALLNLEPDDLWETITHDRETIADFYNMQVDITCRNKDHRTVALTNISRQCPIPEWDIWIIGVDMTENMLAEIKLKEYSEQLEEMVKIRTHALEETQSDLVRAEKLAAVGELAGSVAHHLRNPLGVISNAVYYLREVLTNSDDLDMIKIINTSVKNATSIVDDLINFAHIKSPNLMGVSVPYLITRVVTRHNPPENVHIEQDYPPDLLAINVDLTQTELVFSELFTNAYEAMPEGGILSIAASKQRNGVEIRFTNTGVTIPQDQMDRVFEPLFTTKNQGVGLGLATAKNLVEVNGGTIHLEKSDDNGTTFTVWYPVHMQI